MLDPLTEYHTALRATRSSGYPNMQYMQPHPYEMAWNAQQGDRLPFMYGRGRALRIMQTDPNRQGLNRAVIPPQRQQAGPLSQFLQGLGPRGGLRQGYMPPPRRSLGDRSWMM